MRTIRNCVFETNSSSCHVLTVADQNEYELIKNKQAVIYVAHYCSDDDEVFDSEILTKESFAALLEKQFGSEQYETYQEFFETIWKYLCTEVYFDDKFNELVEKYNVPHDISYKVEDIVACCRHEEDAIELFDGAIKKTANGATIYVTCWSKYC